VTDDPSSRLGEIKARLENATPGPWQEIGTEWTDDGVMVSGYVCYQSDVHQTQWSDITGDGVPAADAQFIAAAPADVGWLLEHVEQLQREVTRLNGNWAALSRERDLLWAQRQACLDLFGICDRQPHLGSRRGYVSVAALREAVGADDDH